MANKPSPKQMMAELHTLAGTKKLVLHVGCGRPLAHKLHERYRNDDWFEVRCDIDARVKPHIVADMQNLSMLPDKSIDALWNSHVIEHLEAHQVQATLVEWHRVIKDGGHIFMTLPDLRAVATHIAHGRLEDPLYQSPAGPINAIDIVYGYGEDLKTGNKFMAHRTGFSGETLAKKLIAAGFSNLVVRCEALNLWAEGIKLPLDHPQRAERARIVRDGNKDVTPPPEPPLSAMRHPGALWKGKRPDELDVPPSLPLPF